MVVAFDADNDDGGKALVEIETGTTGYNDIGHEAETENDVCPGYEMVTYDEDIYDCGFSGYDDVYEDDYSDGLDTRKEIRRREEEN